MSCHNNKTYMYRKRNKQARTSELSAAYLSFHLLNVLRGVF